MTRLAIGISGQVAAGKTTASHALEPYGFGYTRISMVIDLVLHERGEMPSRERHQAVGWELHLEKGQAWLCEQAISLLPPNLDRFVLDGLRWVDDVNYMRTRFGDNFLHIHVLAPEALRKLRFRKDSKGIAYEEVVSHEVEQEVQALADLADIVLRNDGEEKDFVTAVLGRILERQLSAD